MVMPVGASCFSDVKNGYRGFSSFEIELKSQGHSTNVVMKEDLANLGSNEE